MKTLLSLFCLFAMTVTTLADSPIPESPLYDPFSAVAENQDPIADKPVAKADEVQYETVWVKQCDNGVCRMVPVRRAIRATVNVVANTVANTAAVAANVIAAPACLICGRVHAGQSMVAAYWVESAPVVASKVVMVSNAGCGCGCANCNCTGQAAFVKTKQRIVFAPRLLFWRH